MPDQDVLEKLHKLAEHIKAHREETKERVLKLSPAAQEPAHKILLAFCSDKEPAAIKAEIDAIKAGVSDAVRAELDAHKAEIAKKIGIELKH